MSEFMQIVQTSLEYAVEKRQEIEDQYGDLQRWSRDDESQIHYWDGQADALHRVLMTYHQTHGA